MNRKWFIPIAMAAMLFVSACVQSASERFTAAQAGVTPVFQAAVTMRGLEMIDDAEWVELKRLAVLVNERLMQWKNNPANSELEKGYQAALSVYNTFKAGIK